MQTYWCNNYSAEIIFTKLICNVQSRYFVRAIHCTVPKGLKRSTGIEVKFECN